MDSTIVTAFTVYLLFIIHETAANQVSKKEELELEREWKSLQKPAIKTIATKYGDVFDCVDIHKQPSLDHPLLRNHTLQLKPSSIPDGSPYDPLHNGSYAHFELDDGGCPDGSVPIRRIEKEDLRRARAYFQQYSSTTDPNSPHKRGWHFAETLAINTSIPIVAARGLLAIYNPQLVSNVQHSDNLVYVKTGMFATHNVLQAGWAVYPLIYKDTQTRLHSIWTADNYKRTGCIDMMCKGFVQISTSFPLGMPIQPLSQCGGPQYQLPFAISQDQVSGNWWLIVSRNAVVGYWPKELFTGLATSADEAGWGGRAFNPLREAASPQMGSGRLPTEGFGKSCFVDQMQIIRRRDARYEDLNAGMMTSHVDSPSCYDLKLFVDDEDRLNMYFGGPGGQCGFNA